MSDSENKLPDIEERSPGLCRTCSKPCGYGFDEIVLCSEYQEVKNNC